MSTQETRRSEKMSLTLAGMATGVVAWVLCYEIVAVVLFAVGLAGDSFLSVACLVGGVFGLVAGPIIAFRDMSIKRAVFWCVGFLCLLYVTFGLVVLSLGIPIAGGKFAVIHCVTGIVFYIGSGALSAATTVWLKREVWPWVESLFAPPPPLPYTDETGEEQRISL